VKGRTSNLVKITTVTILSQKQESKRDTQILHSLTITNFTHQLQSVKHNKYNLSRPFSKRSSIKAPFCQAKHQEWCVKMKNV